MTTRISVELDVPSPYPHLFYPKARVTTDYLRGMVLDILMENMRTMRVVTIRQRWNHSDMYVDDGSGEFALVRRERDSGGGVATTFLNIPLPTPSTLDTTSHA